MTHPCGVTGSLEPAFAPDRAVALSVKHPYTHTLFVPLPTVLRVPLRASVTLLEATTPVKLPTTHCLPHKAGLEPKYNKAGISRTTPPPLAWQLQSLPAILHILDSRPM